MNWKSKFEKVNDYMEGRGFYVVLALCMCALGGSGYYLYSSIVEHQEVAVALPTQVVVTVAPTQEVLKPVVARTPEPTVAPTPDPEPSPEVTPEPTPEIVETVAIYTWPVVGEIIADYSLEVLAYDEVMGDWRVHTGVDIQADVGTPVKALSGGTVVAVVDDLLMGTVVVIDHGNGIESMYANLAENPAVFEGDEVESGDVIGEVGETSVAESNRPPHLHFEMKDNGKEVDPEQYLT